MRHLVDHVAAALFWDAAPGLAAGLVAGAAAVWAIATGLAREAKTFELATTMTRWMFRTSLHVAGGVCRPAFSTRQTFCGPCGHAGAAESFVIACALWLAQKWHADFFARTRGIIGGCCSWPAGAALYRLGMLPRFGIR